MDQVFEQHRRRLGYFVLAPHTVAIYLTANFAETIRPKLLFDFQIKGAHLFFINIIITIWIVENMYLLMI